MENALADWVASDGGPISRGVIDAMYARDPFWLERYGPNGLQAAREDGGFHIRHLVSALRVANDGIMETYARWLRELLVARGMCTQHLADNFIMLGYALKRSAPMDATPAVIALTKAASALTYIHTEARKLQDNAHTLVVQWLMRLGLTPNAVLRLDAESVVSYAADSLAYPDAAPLAGFVAYRGRQPISRGLWRERSADVLHRELLVVLQGVLPADAVSRIAWTTS